MKVRDSGMPEEAYWESLFDVPGVLNSLGLDDRIRDVIEVGCGYGTFTIPVAGRIKGVLHAFDIDADMIERTRARARTHRLENVHLSLRDVLSNGFDVPGASVDAVLLFNILHAEEPVTLLKTAAAALTPTGRVLAIHWRSDIATPRGPDLSIRPRPDQIATWAASAGLRADPPLLLPPWHFGLVLRR